MEAADRLCDSLFRWLENQKHCAEELEKLAQKLKDVHQGSNIAKVVGGAAASVASISGALIATALTRDQARPVVPAAAVGTVGSLAGAAVSATSTLVETLITSCTFKKATKLIKEDEKVGDKAGTDIQKQLQDLKDRCAEAPLGAHADELDCEVTTLLMCALAKRSNTPVPLDFLRGFNRATFFRHLTPGGLAPAEASDFICQALGLDRSPEITTSLKVSPTEMMKNIELIGIKAAKAGSEAQGASGVGMSLCDLIVKSEELIKDKQVSEASKFLRDSAREIRDGQQKLKEDLDAMHEIIQKLLQMKRIIENLGEYSLSMDENGQRIIDYIMGTCTDSTVRSWLQGLTHQIEFVNLVRFFQERLSPIPEDLTKAGEGHIHIVIVAHGGIDDQFMPSGGLVPRPYIRDTILYSPWNCSIDANTAFAIAQGFIEVTDRQFPHMAHCQPNPLPNHWNSMRRSLHDIPEILLAPVTPEEGAWALFQQFWMNKMEMEDRVIIPYLVPKCLVKAFGEIPLYMLIFMTSFLLMIYGKTATVHLVAGLGRGGGTPSSSEERERQQRVRSTWFRPAWFRQKRLRKKWVTQYAYTNDGTCMSVDMGNTKVDSVLYRALRSLFNTNL